MEGRFNGGFFALPVWGAYIWRGLYIGGAYFRNFKVSCIKCNMNRVTVTVKQPKYLMYVIRVYVWNDSEHTVFSDFFKPKVSFVTK